MNIGFQFRVENSWGPFTPSVDYYFLRSDSKLNRVMLVIFLKKKNDFSAQILTLNREEFERALVEGVIQSCETQRTLPIWLKELEGKNYKVLEQFRKDPKKTHNQRIQERFLVIAEAVSCREHILGSEDPISVLNLLARSHSPSQNPTRFKLWFFSYTLFGDDICALFPKFQNIGRWSRENLSSYKRLGRKNNDGNKVRYNATAEMRQQIYDAYPKYRNSEKTLYDSYSRFMREYLGCLVIQQKGHRDEFIHPNSVPIPSFEQFKYHAFCHLGVKKLRVASIGELAEKSKSGSKGRFSEELANLYEKVEFDGFYIEEKATGLDGETAVAAFCVVRAVCGVSGITLGLGFSRGDENLEAYKNCLFCMATNKVKYLNLYGLTGELYDWPCEGLPPAYITDRGPGSVLDVFKNVRWLTSLELTPSGSGQSKASVESKHPRTKVTLKKPGYFQSSHDYINLAKSYLAKACRANITSNANGRMSPDMIRENILPSPNEIFKFLDQRARTSARRMAFQDAVRAFLPFRPVKVKSDGVWLLGRKYSSPSLVETGIFDDVARRGTMDAQVYVNNMCVRYVWFELNGFLHELGAVFSIRTEDGERNISIFELEELEEMARRNRSIHSSLKPVQGAYIDQVFKDDVGEELDAGVLRVGKPRRTRKVITSLAEQKSING